MQNQIDHIFKKSKHLETNQVILKPTTKDDFDCFRACYSNLQVRRLFSLSAPKSEAESKETFEKLLSMQDQKYYFMFTIIHKKTNKKIGDFNIHAIEKNSSRVDIGYALLPEYWNKGIMTEVLKMVFKYLFEEIHLHKVCAYTNAENIASRQVLEKCGFRLEGTLKEHNHYFHLDRFCDEMKYGLLRKEYE